MQQLGKNNLPRSTHVPGRDIDINMLKMFGAGKGAQAGRFTEKRVEF